MDYDYKHSLVRNRKNGAKWFRFALIFAVVAAVTALILWKIIPASERNTASSGETSSKKESLLQNDMPDEEKESKKSTSAASLSSTDGGMTEGEEKTLPAAAAEKNDNAAAAAVSEVKTPPAETVFEKGKVSPGDPPAELDKPQIPIEKKQLQNEAGKKLLELETLLAQKRFADLSKEASKTLETLTFGSVPYRKTLELLTQANWERFVSGDTSGNFASRHTVSPGEYLGRLARKYKTTVQAAVLVNKLKNTNIVIGRKLCFPGGDWQISVSKKHRLLHLLRNGRVFMGFDIGIGRNGKTPVADFVISTRLKHPEYRTPDGRVFKHGEPGNELGDFFLKLAPVGTPGRPLAGYGIHGTSDETSVTRSLSNGCIRMRNADVRRLYYIVPSGTRVTIRE